MVNMNCVYSMVSGCVTFFIISLCIHSIHSFLVYFLFIYFWVNYNNDEKESACTICIFFICNYIALISDQHGHHVDSLLKEYESH